MLFRLLLYKQSNKGTVYNLVSLCVDLEYWADSKPAWRFFWLDRWYEIREI